MFSESSNESGVHACVLLASHSGLRLLRAASILSSCHATHLSLHGRLKRHCSSSLIHHPHHGRQTPAHAHCCCRAPTANEPPGGLARAARRPRARARAAPCATSQRAAAYVRRHGTSFSYLLQGLSATTTLISSSSLFCNAGARTTAVLPPPLHWRRELSRRHCASTRLGRSDSASTTDCDFAAKSRDCHVLAGEAARPALVATSPRQRWCSERRDCEYELLLQGRRRAQSRGAAGGAVSAPKPPSRRP